MVRWPSCQRARCRSASSRARSKASRDTGSSRQVSRVRAMPLTKSAPGGGQAFARLERLDAASGGFAPTGELRIRSQPEATIHALPLPPPEGAHPEEGVGSLHQATDRPGVLSPWRVVAPTSSGSVIGTMSSNAESLRCWISCAKVTAHQ